MEKAQSLAKIKKIVGVACKPFFYAQASFGAIFKQLTLVREAMWTPSCIGKPCLSFPPTKNVFFIFIYFGLIDEKKCKVFFKKKFLDKNSNEIIQKLNWNK